MRIVVNDIAASVGGALTVLKDFYNSVKDYDSQNEWIFLLGDNYLEETGNIQVMTLPEIKNSKSKKLWFDLFSGRKVINALKPDVVLSLQNIITFGVTAPQYVFIHQSIPFQSSKNFSFFKSNERIYAIYQHFIGALIKRSAKKADKIFVQTKWMKEAVAEKCHIPQERIFNVLPKVEDLSAYVEEGNFQRNRFFYPTARGVYKNNACIYKAVEILREQGISDFSVELTTKGPNSENIRHLDRIPREEVLKKYNQGTLLFPSYIETFGYPMAEARQIGTLILASDCPFSHEVLEGYENAYFFDPFDPNALADLMKKVICGELQLKKADKTNHDNTDHWAPMILEILHA